MTKNIVVTQNTESGFVALFFVLIFASALGFLMFSLSLKSKNMLALFGNMRNDNAARVATGFCLQKLLVNKMSNIGYKPLVGVDIQIHEGLTCRYKSFVETPQISTQQVDTQVSMKTYKANVLQKFTVHILGTYAKNGTVFATTSHEIIREIYITDSL